MYKRCQMNRMCEEYAEYADTALTVPITTAMWIHQRDRMHKLVRLTLPGAELKTAQVLHYYFFMCDHMKVSASDMALAREVLMWKRRMDASQVEHSRLMRRKRAELEEALKVLQDSWKNIENWMIFWSKKETNKELSIHRSIWYDVPKMKVLNET